MAKIQTTHISKCWQECVALGTPSHWCWEWKMTQPYWETVWQFLTELDIVLLYDPAIMFLGTYPFNLKTYVHIKSCAQMFIADICNCSSGTQLRWMEKLWQIHTYNAALFTNRRRNKLSSHENTGEKLKWVLLSEWRQPESLHTVCFQFYDIVQRAKLAVQFVYTFKTGQ